MLFYLNSEVKSIPNRCKGLFAFFTIIRFRFSVWQSDKIPNGTGKREKLMHSLTGISLSRIYYPICVPLV